MTNGPTLMNMKNGSSIPSSKMQLKQRAGEATFNYGANPTPEQLETRVLELTKDNTELINKQRERERISREAMEASYKEWLKIPLEDKYINEQLLVPDTVLIRLFYYNESENISSVLILSEEDKKSFHKVLPIGRILSSNVDFLKPGDIVKLPAVYGKNVLSHEWVQWSKDVAEQPSLKREYPMPPMYIGKLNEWSNYIYQVDPFSDTSMEDQHTFCIPYRILQTKSI